MTHASSIMLSCWVFSFEIIQKFSLTLTKGQISETRILSSRRICWMFSNTTS